MTFWLEEATRFLLAPAPTWLLFMLAVGLGLTFKRVERSVETLIRKLNQY